MFVPDGRKDASPRHEETQGHLPHVHVCERERDGSSLSIQPPHSVLSSYSVQPTRLIPVGLWAGSSLGSQPPRHASALGQRRLHPTLPLQRMSSSFPTSVPVHTSSCLLPKPLPVLPVASSSSPAQQLLTKGTVFMSFVSHSPLLVAAWSHVSWRILENRYIPGKSDLIN